MKPARTVVFLGPSLAPARAAVMLSYARFAPPAARGDLATAVQRGAKCVALIDGRFDQDLAVGPREILGILRSGATVYGSSSMGALRAAELYADGMIGVGRVFRWFRDGLIEGEDEVAMAFEPRGLSPLSVPLVNVRWVLQWAVHRGVTKAQAARVLEAARQTPFRIRTWPGILTSLRLPEPVKTLIWRRAASPNGDLKALDAATLLRRLSRDGAKDDRP